MSGTLRINEVFYSIQGESTRTGRPCVFVRLAGCHLRCAYCDTEYAFKEGRTRTIDDIIEEVVGHPCSFVEITGGEPLLQERVHDLMARLCDMGKTVAIETSGACDIGACDPRVIRIMDIKTPGSGEVERMDWSNLDRLTGRDEVKFVITGRDDYEFARDLIREHGLTRRVAAVLLSPVFEQPTGLEILGMQGLPMRTLAEWMLEDGLEAVLQPQLHKFIWDPQTRGV
jgi:7-carboxy-7-deazaguanine synthase